MTRPSVADVVIAHLAADEANLRARLADTEAERDAYRGLYHEAVHLLAEVTRDFARVRARYHETLDENRRRRGAERRAA